MVKASFYNNPFIGLYLRASDKLFLCPPISSEKLKASAREALGVEPVELFIDNSPLLGIFTAMNSNGIVLPSLARDESTGVLRKAGLNVCFIDRLSPGNNIAANDKGAVVSSYVPRDDLAKIRDCLGVEVHQMRTSFNPATTTVATNRGLLAYNELTATELKRLEAIFKVRGVNGTSNMGVQFNSLGVVANSHGALIGQLTSGFESQKIYEALTG